MSFLVDDIDIDLINYSGPFDIGVSTEYVEPSYCNIVVERFDSIDGWDEPLQVFISNSRGITRTIVVKPSPTCIYILRENAGDFGEFVCSTRPINTTFYHNYTIPQIPPICDVSREVFNKLFYTDVVVLPSTLFAVGIKRGVDGGTSVYQYHESYGGYPWTYEIELTIRHIVSVGIKYPVTIPPPTAFYFIICAHDGYMENLYPSRRTVPHRIGETEYEGKSVVSVEDPATFPVLHKNRYVLGQSVHPDTDYVVAVPDRYYFCLNRYNGYRSIHGGIPFHTKINRVVYAGNVRGTRYNFTTRRDIECSQREYFKSDAVPKDNIVVGDGITQRDMIRYKYILDIDGNASTWDATAWKLNSGSVIMKTDSNWVQWFYSDYKEWEHYVPIADDFTDIQAKYKWCEEHQKECEDMVRRCKELFQNVFRYQNVEKYTANMLHHIAIHPNARLSRGNVLPMNSYTQGSHSLK